MRLLQSDVRIRKPRGKARRVSAETAKRLGRQLARVAGSGDVAAAEKLISRGADLNFQNRSGETPLTFAAAWNQPSTANCLLEHGADPNLSDRTGGTALMLAAQHGTSAMVRDLLAHEADPTAVDSSGFDALAHVEWRPQDEDAKKIRQMIRRASKS
jgi:ankyrin repeat protein